MSETRAISITSRRERSSSFLFLQGKAPKEIHTILTETLAYFLSGRAKDLISTPVLHHLKIPAAFLFIMCMHVKNKVPSQAVKACGKMEVKCHAS